MTTRSAIVAGRRGHRLEDGRIQCDVCPRYCTLQDGQQGLCFVRARQGGEIPGDREITDLSQWVADKLA